MELVFQKEPIQYLSETVYDRLYQELTAEVMIPETMPELGRIVDCFGTVTVQTKNVEDGAVSISGGIQAGVLYVPEGSPDSLQRIQAYLPFTVTKKLNTEADTVLFYWGWLRNMEARFINARKVLLRANLGSELTLLKPSKLELCQIEKQPAGLMLKSACYPLRLPVSAVEKELQLADEVLLPEEAPGIEQLLKWSCVVEITDTSVIGDKVVFKGGIRLRTLYSVEDGAPTVWEGTVPFSQYAELETEPEDPMITVQPLLRHVELDTDGQPDSHRLLLNLTATAQILVRGSVPVCLTEDAYYLCGNIRPEWQTIDLNVCPELLEQIQTEELALPPEAIRVLDWTVLTDPALPARGGAAESGPALLVNLLYYDGEDNLQSKTIRSQVDVTCGSAESVEYTSAAEPTGETQAMTGVLRLPLRLWIRGRKQLQYRNLCGGKLEPAERRDMPSLVVKTGSGALWEIAKQNGSTVAAIRTANHLETDCLSEERLLLIPAGCAQTTGEDEA